MTYSALRLGLLGVCFALGYWAGLRTWLLLVVAVLVAWGLSYVLLAGPRDAAAAYVARRVERRHAVDGRGPRAADDDAAVEDALDESARAGLGRTGVEPDAEAGPGAAPGQPGETARPRPSSTP